MMMFISNVIVMFIISLDPAAPEWHALDRHLDEFEPGVANLAGTPSPKP